MKRAFRTRTLGRWMRKAGLAERHLCQALGEMIDGLIDADLGGHVVKKRVALPGKGKRGGARIIVATRLEDRWFVIFGFGKNERDDIGKDELKALRELAADLLALDGALERLAQQDPRKARVVELRYFAGMEFDEIADHLSLSNATVRRDFSLAKLWLAEAMRD